MKLILIIVTFALAFRVTAQVVRQPVAAHNTALGAYSQHFSDVFSATSNPAALAAIPSGAFAVYGERRFLLSELSSYTAIIAVPAGSGAFGFQADYFGSSSFNETALGLLYARRISAAIDVGGSFNYYRVKIPGYGGASSVNFDVAAVFHLTEKLHSGIHVYNPTSSNLGKTGSEKLASIYTFGLGYEASEQLFTAIEIVKHEDQPIVVNAGLQYYPDKRVVIRCGISAGSDNSYAGVGLTVAFGRIDMN
ncbi:MAG: hypothetical protein M3040_02990, partial [Bacteroidota bacterium]|nr:hypothetical protein [Bacteroidota bacterium]